MFLQNQFNANAKEIFGAFILLAANATFVVASVNRQENLSGRLRALTKEFREIAKKGKKARKIEKDRLLRLYEQITLFEPRLELAVWGHMALYSALLPELFAFCSFAAGLMFPCYETLLNQSAILALALAAILALLGMACHLKEYRSSFSTMDVELDDIKRYQDMQQKLAKAGVNAPGDFLRRADGTRRGSSTKKGEDVAERI